MPVELGGTPALEGPASTFALNNPMGMTIDEGNRMFYVADAGNNRVVQINMDTLMASVVAGTGSCDGNIGDNGPAVSASLCFPTKVALDSNKNLIIVDAGHNTIRKVAIPTTTVQGLAVFSPSNKDLSLLQRNEDGTWVRKYRDGSQAHFDVNGYQTRFIDTLMRVTSFEYDSNNNLQFITDPTDQKTTLFYSGGKLNQVRDPSGRSTYFQYNGNNLSAINFPDGTSKTFEYDSNGQMIKEYNQKGVPRQYAYNEWNRLAQVKDVDGTTVNMNDTASQTVMNNYTGGAKGQLQGTGTGQGQVSDTVTDPKNVTTELAKDFQGFVSKIKDAKGNETEIHRDLNGNPILVKNPDGSIKSFIYDPVTRDLLSTKDENFNITESTTYDSKGRVLTKTDGNGATVTNTYNELGLLLVEAHSSGLLKTYTYYPSGLVSSVSV